MIKKIGIIFILLTLSSCSFDTRSGIWTEESISLNNEENKEIKELFKKEILDENEFSPKLKVEIKNINENRFKYKGNNFGALIVNSNFERLSKFSFKKIEYFDQFNPEPVFIDNDLIFFDKKGSIIRFDQNSNIKWKVNHYNKKEKKLLPILKITKEKNSLIVTDNFASIYSINSYDGKLIWKNDHEVSFISQIKIDDNRFFVLDSNNVFTCFSLVDGQKIWQFKGEKKLINSQNETSIIINEESVIMNNSRGEIISLNKLDGNLNWITPTIDFGESLQSFLIKNSDLVLDNNNIYFSNDQNSFFSLDVNLGFINWKQNISSYLRPIIINDFIFTISPKGYFYVVEKNTGNIIRVTDLFYNLKSKKRKKIKIIGFISTVDKIYLSTNNGKIMKVNIADGKIDLIYRVGRDRISKPYVNNSKLYIVKDNSIIKIN